MLPDKIFLTGVPGSRWSGISQTIESISGFNTSDRSDDRSYQSNKFSGHVGMYFGEGMELEAILDEQHIDSAWGSSQGCKMVKSHDWAYCLNEIKEKFPSAWIMLVYRPDMSAYAWWHEAGGFNIKYPNYSRYKDSQGMLAEIIKQNKLILDFGHKYQSTWNYFTAEWCLNNFGSAPNVDKTFEDILVTLIK